MVLTGMHVPIIRSFAMACLYTIAVLAGRRAISMRGLALAATVLMLIEPQEVPGVSFQMSFSAVLALIAGYEALRPMLRRCTARSWHRRLAMDLIALALTSALAGHRLRTVRRLPLRSHPGVLRRCEHGRGAAHRVLGDARGADRLGSDADRS